MALRPEVKAAMSAYLQGSAKYHGDFKYPAWAFEYAKLADEVKVDMPPVDGYPYKLSVFTAHNKAENGPLHVNIHGGGFSNPHQINDTLFSAWLADQIRGVVVDVDYTLSGEAAWPVCLDQCRDAGKYAYAHAAEWGCDPKRISIGGYSAGGTLTMGVLMKAKETGEVPYCLGVNGYGPTRLSFHEDQRPEGEEYWKTGGRNFAFVDLLFDGEVEKSFDPYFSCAYASDEQLKGLPPVAIIAAGEDAFRKDNADLAQRLAYLGENVSFCCIKGAVHGFIPHFMDYWEEGGLLVAEAIKKY